MKHLRIHPNVTLELGKVVEDHKVYDEPSFFMKNKIGAPNKTLRMVDKIFSQILVNVSLKGLMLREFLKESDGA